MSTPWTPPPPLAKAVQQALATFQRHYPRSFALAGDPSDAGRAFLAEWARGFVGRTVHLEVIVDAAQRWVAEQDEAPRAAKFVMFCRTIERQLYPHLDTAPTKAPPPDAFDGAKDAAGINKRSRYMHEQLGSWPEVTACWALMEELAAGEDERQRILFGNVTRAEIDVAIGLLRGGRRPKAGPMSASLPGGAA